MFLNIVPCFTIISSVTMPNMRGVGCGVALAAIHLLGDAWSPTFMGWVADTFGQKDSMATGFGLALAALAALPGGAAGPRPAESDGRHAGGDSRPFDLGNRSPGRVTPFAARDGPSACQAASNTEPPGTEPKAVATTLIQPPSIRVPAPLFLRYAQCSRRCQVGDR